MARCSCEHEHGEHRRDTGECRECRCNDCNCMRCCPEEADVRGNQASRQPGIRGACQVQGCGEASVGLCQGFRACREHYYGCDDLDEEDFDADERSNPSPASASDTDVAFSIDETAMLIDVFSLMDQSGIFQDPGGGARHYITLSNVFEDLKQWDHQPSGPFRKVRGEEIYPAVWGYNWDLLREALEELESGILFSKQAPFRPGNRMPDVSSMPARQADAIRMRYELMQQMSRIASLWRYKLGMAKLSTVVRYGRGY